MRLPLRPPPLAGREVLLTELDARLSAGDGPAPRTVTLSGLGGAGKSSVAAEYAHRHLAEVGVAWQFAAENETVLKAGFDQLAAQLGARGVADVRDPVASVHAVLARFGEPWLLIFDNAPDMASVEAFLPPAGPGRVLITSRNPRWTGQVLEVPMLGQEVAAGLLVSRTGDPDPRAAQDLAGELGGLPLALEQAAAYIQASGGSLARYLELFRRRRRHLLARGEPAGFSGTVATIWRLAFEHLEQTAPGAVGLLRLLSHCAPEDIPLDLLLQPRPGLAVELSPEVAPVLVPLLEDELEAGDAIAALRRHSLISPPAGGSVSVHRLVQAVTTDQMPVELAGAWQRAAAAVIEAALPADAEPPQTWPVFESLLPHAGAALAAESAGMGRVAWYLGVSGSWATARDLWQIVLEARELVLGAEHPETLAARADHARWTGQAGDAAGARDLFAELLPVRERVSGPEDPHTLAARANLASWTSEAGDPAGARDQVISLLPVSERVLGAEHLHTLIARGNLANWTGLAGDPARARDLLAELLPVTKRVLGAEHTHTLSVHGGLASWTGLAGDPAAARDLLAELLPAYGRVLGPEHPMTLTAKANLAALTGQAGDAAGARDQSAALLPVHEQVLGPEHPSTLTTRGNLAFWTGEAGDAAGARDQYTALLLVRERVLGPEHPDTLGNRDNLAHWTGKAGDAVGARDQYKSLLPVHERVYGREHPDTLGVRDSLAYWISEARWAESGTDWYPIV